MTETADHALASQETSEAAAARDQREFGFWLYLMSDAIIFGLLFATYAVMAGRSPGAPDGRELFSLTRLSAETLLLLTSSLTFGLASVALHSLDARRAHIWLLVTFILGAGFVGLELSEFSGLIAQGVGPDSSGLMSAFFVLLGAHGLHVSMGLAWIAILSLQLQLEGPTPDVRSRLLRLGLFWHFLDIVWIGIYSIVYLPAMI